MDEKLGRPTGTSEQLITFVKDRPGHDLRYAIDATKMNKIRLETFCNFRRRFINNHRLVLANQKVVR